MFDAKVVECGAIDLTNPAWLRTAAFFGAQEPVFADLWRMARGAGVRKPPREETAGRASSDGAACAIEDGVSRAISICSRGIFEEPQARIRAQLLRYGTSIANWGK